jgi:hypothetical protein
MPDFWKADPLITSDVRNPAVIVLHRYAGLRGFSCDPKRSNINRGSYFCEVNRVQGNGIVPNVAMGVGRSPLEAAVDGYSKVVPNDPIWATVVMQAELELLRRAAVADREAMRLEGKLAAAIVMLEDTLSLVRA